MTHTAGLTYGWMYNHPVDAMYRSAGFEWDTPRDLDLAGCCSRLGEAPACSASRARSGTTRSRPTCSAASSRSRAGNRSSEFLAERVFGPLGMKETSFYVEGEGAERLAVLYSPDLVTGRATRAELMGEAALQPAEGAPRRRRSRVDGGRLPPVHPDAAAARGARWRPDPRHPNRLVHDSQPPSRRRRPGPVRQSDRRAGRSRESASGSASRSWSTQRR